MGGLLTEKIDIYCFGVILIELISGREAVQSGPDGVRSSIVTWVSPFGGYMFFLYKFDIVAFFVFGINK
jgi:hypothetical protein